MSMNYQHRYRKAWLFIFIFLHLCASLVSAESKEDLSLWEAGIMVGGLSYPHYRGSKDREFRALPFPYVIYRGKFIKSRNGALHVGTERGRFRLGLSFFASPPVEDTPSRVGMEDLGLRLESGPSLIFEQPRPWGEHWAALRWRFSTSLDDDTIHYVGSLGEIIFGQTLKKGVNKWKWGWHTFFGDALYHRTLYGVEAQEALSWRPAYRPTSGFGGMAMTVSHGRDFKRGRYGEIFLRADFMEDAIWADSPLATQKNQLMAGFIFRYRLFASDKKVTNSKEIPL
jgi:MipA family protein